MGEVENKFRGRAKTAFARSLKESTTGIDVMLGEHSAKGRLQSGATIIAAISIFEECSHRALNQVLLEAAKLIEHRGRKWARAMAGISTALDQHMADAPEFLEPTIRLADQRNTASIAKAVEERLAEAGAQLRAQLQDFQQGWTAPVHKPWKERHPILYPIAMLILGALITLAVQLATGT